MLTNCLVAAEVASDGDTFVGLLIIAVIAWFVWSLCRPKGYTITGHSHATIKPRR